MPAPASVIAYVPVIHAGYLAFFRKYEKVDAFWLFGPEIIARFDYLRKEIRALEPAAAAECLRAGFPGKEIGILTLAGVDSLARAGGLIVMPDEDVCRELAKQCLLPSQVIFEPTFLRWDRNNTVAECLPSPDRIVSVDVRDRALMGRAKAEALKSSDWWRQVGAVIARDGHVLVAAHNRHMPTEYTPYVDGDPRNAFFRGVNIELGTALHAEKAAICECARRGLATDGAEMYVKVFPCPPCAKAIVAAGIRRVYYSEGYSMLDGETVLAAAGIETVLVA